VGRRAWHQYHLVFLPEGHKYREGRDDRNIGDQFAPAYGHARYATEASRVVIEYGFQVLAHDRLVAFAQSAHRGSVRVLEKLEFTQDGRCQDEGGNRCVFYVLMREEWQVRTPFRITIP
jgi:[ribosomal protein S5]-alanine N-acetyltransferase